MKNNNAAKEQFMQISWGMNDRTILSEKLDILLGNSLDLMGDGNLFLEEIE